MNGSALLYFYSSLFQGWAALISIVWILAVFRLEAWSNSADKAISKAIGVIETFVSLSVTEPLPMSRRDLLKKLEQWLEDNKQSVSNIVHGSKKSVREISLFNIHQATAVLDRMDDLKLHAIVMFFPIVFFLTVLAGMIVVVKVQWLVFQEAVLAFTFSASFFLLLELAIFGMLYLVNPET